ncbi:FAD synthetase [Pseudalkalibacillus sp. A8]|uniref:FAD synthetase n=1 Tax=Pseudalkalibacillus sp. A8 TaxID=3382641 RepID=UPI0038B4FB69
MQVYSPGTLKLPASVLTIGAFDGVHRGHQTLLLKTKERAKKLGVPFVVYTFDPPPKVFYKKCQMITSLEEKLNRLKMIGADHVIVASFNELYAKQEVPVFMQELKKINPVEIWEGPNFQFGKDRKGSIKELRRDFKVGILKPLKCEQGELISSTRIRVLQKQGNHSLAQNLLGDLNSISL